MGHRISSRLMLISTSRRQRITGMCTSMLGVFCWSMWFLLHFFLVRSCSTSMVRVMNSTSCNAMRNRYNFMTCRGDAIGTDTWTRSWSWVWGANICAWTSPWRSWHPCRSSTRIGSHSLNPYCHRCWGSPRSGSSWDRDQGYPHPCTRRRMFWLWGSSNQLLLVVRSIWSTSSWFNIRMVHSPTSRRWPSSTQLWHHWTIFRYRLMPRGSPPTRCSSRTSNSRNSWWRRFGPPPWPSRSSRCITPPCNAGSGFSSSWRLGSSWTSTSATARPSWIKLHERYPVNVPSWIHRFNNLCEHNIYIYIYRIRILSPSHPRGRGSYRPSSTTCGIIWIVPMDYIYIMLYIVVSIASQQRG